MRIFSILFIAKLSFSLIDLIKLPTVNSQVNYQTQSTWDGQCNKGFRQSPINIPTFKINQTSNKTINIHFQDRNIIADPAINKDLKSNYEQSTIHIVQQDYYNLRYKSKYYLWHTPAQHKLNGFQLDAELQIVYECEENFKKYTVNTFAIVSILFKRIPNWSSQTTLFKTIDFTKKNEINFGQTIGILLSEQELFNYNGSFSQPDCKQNVDRYVSSKVLNIKEAEYLNLRKHINNANPNNRRIQMLRKRNITRILNTKFEDVKKQQAENPTSTSSLTTNKNQQKQSNNNNQQKNNNNQFSNNNNNQYQSINNPQYSNNNQQQFANNRFSLNNNQQYSQFSNRQNKNINNQYMPQSLNLNQQQNPQFSNQQISSQNSNSNTVENNKANIVFQKGLNTIFSTNR